MKTPAYDMNERIRFNQQLRDVEKAPLSDRKAAAAEWLDDLQNHPETIAERIGWLLYGNYGFGSYQAACEVVTNKRMNRRAWLSITIAALEWQCPSNYARAAWNKLTADQQAKLNALIDSEIEDALEAPKD